MIKHHMLSQNPSRCLCIQLSVCVTALDPHPSLRTLWSAVIMSPNFSARGKASPVRLLQEAFVLLVLKQTSQFRSFRKWMKILCFLDFVATFVECSESESWEMCAGACTSVEIRLSVKSSDQNGMSANGSFSSFLSLLKDSCSSLLVASSSLRSNTESEDELAADLFPDAWSASGLDDSCGGDVGDELLPELTDNPGTTRGTKLSVLQIIFFSFLVNRGSWPLTHSWEYPWSLQSLPSDRTAGVTSSSCTVTNRFRSWKRTLVPPRGCALLH